MIYLDYAANTPIDKSVLDYFYDISLNYYGNPNSEHKMGKEAKRIIDEATNNIAKNLGVYSDEIIYTSGSTETNNMVIKGICERYKNRGKHIIISSLEHNSVVSSVNAMQDEGFEVDIVHTNNRGLVDIEELKSLIRKDTILVSIVLVDSELGIIQPIEEIGKLLKNYPNIVFYTDATGAMGKVMIDYSLVDLFSFAPHKFYGLPGIGVLIKKRDISLVPIINGGRSTSIYRSGTPNTALIASCDRALDIALLHREERYNYVLNLNSMIVNHLKNYSFIHINSGSLSIPYIINFSVKGIKSSYFAKLLGDKGIYVSTKTSCCPIATPSKLVYAVTKDKALAGSSIRVSLSHLTSREDIDRFLVIFDECIKELELDGKV